LGGAGSGRLHSHILPALEPLAAVRNRVHRRAGQMAGADVFCSASHHAAHRRAHIDRTMSRFAGKLIHELLCRFDWEKNPPVLSVTHAGLQVAHEPAVKRRTMRPTPRGICADCPCRGAQNCDANQD
jgi:hypothetical protein